MDPQTIVVRGAREHNLRNVDLDLPRNRLIVFTGVSGSGKSSLAFDTIYAEGQRRYIESLSSYARQFLGQLPKPDVDYIGGLSPAISIQQKTAGRNPRSTVGTITEIADYLRVLYARLGQGHCPRCERPISAQTREQIVGRILALPPGTRFLILAPLVRSQKGEFKDLFAEMTRRGYVRARVDGQLVRLTDDLKLDKRVKHDVEVVVDRLQARGSEDGTFRTRVAEAVEQALALAEGDLILVLEEDGPPPRTTDIRLSARYACTHCDVSYEPPTPQLFSFNSPQGMCRDCDGLGTLFTFDPVLLVPDPSLSFAEGAIPLVGPLKDMGRWRRHIYEGVARALGIDLKTPWRDLPEPARRELLYGTGERHIVWEWKQRRGGVWKHGGRWEGIVPQLMSQFKKSVGPRRRQLEKYMRVMACEACRGERLNPQARAVRVGGKTLAELGRMSIGELLPWFEAYERTLSPTERVIAGELLKEIRGRLGFLLNVGLHYLTLDRPAPTLSGGEAQRIRLAGQIGSGLVGVLYVLDEPSIGLHPRDNARLLASLQRLRDMGNTVLVVEHDEDTMRAADYLVDFGPGPGHRGGRVVAAGPPAQVLAHPDSLTAQYLTGRKQIPLPAERRRPDGRCLRIVGARHNNLKNVTVDIPLGLFVCVTGVSGSGKSSLVNDVLKGLLRDKAATDAADDPETAADIPLTVPTAPLCDRIEGRELIDKVIDIDQSPIGRTPRSNPATYIKLWDEIRALYAALPEAKVRGYQPGRFSFNKPGGRCEACEGNGSNRLEMDFLADVWVICPVCEGRRFNRETLQVRYRGKSIHDVLEMEVAEALEHFEHVPKVRAMLQTLHDVGLDYLKLGQPSPTLSGGEAQRVKLARELVRRGTGRTLYILDEPTTGLHFEDVRKLLEVLHGFVRAGNTVLVIEHNLDVIKTADWVIDLGPEGGAEGGRVVAVGTPEEVAACAQSYTGQALRAVLNPTSGRPAAGVSRNGLAVARAGARTTAGPGTPARHGTAAAGRITHLCVEGACQHNLKNVSVRLPRERMSVFCGPSGSGKSSLALDTIYAEGQRRYVESLSSYARQFLGQVQKPKYESMTGLSPAISIEQKTTSRSPRSTVGTITEIYDYLRVLYARLGTRHCPRCERPVGTQTADEIVDKVLALPEGSRVYILAPVQRTGQERYEALWEEVRRAGYTRVRVDGRSYPLDEVPAIDHRRRHVVEVVVDRAVVRPAARSRLAEAVEQALQLGRGVVHVAHVAADTDEPNWRVDRFSQHLACEPCGLSFEPLNPHHYSFNSPLGWCPTCEGLGLRRGANLRLLVGDPRLTLRQGAVLAWPSLEPGSPWLPFAEAIARYAGCDLDTPFERLTPEQQRVITHGTGDAWLELEPDSSGGRAAGRAKGRRSAPSVARFQYKGLFPALDEAARVSWVYRQRLDHLVDQVACPACRGSRLRPDAAATRFAGQTIGELCDRPLGEVLALFQNLSLTATQRQIAGELVREITNRLQFLVDVGLDYLTLSRPGPTLSGGEAQRIRLASQVGSGLTGVLYVLDEPTIGLHPRDNERLLGALKRLRDLGNTLVVVEHDREVIAAADHVVDFGPGAGDQGGEVVAAGTPLQVRRDPRSLTGQYLSGRRAIPVPTNRRVPTGISPEAVARDRPCLVVRGARQHNLKNVTVAIPLGCLVAVTGVSGSGKSSLVTEVLYNTLARRLNRAQTPGAAHDDILGVEHLDKVIAVDQDPLGNSPSSNPATYTGVFDLIRELFARLPESKVRGYHPRRFSFNQKGGRCEACEGLGQKKIEMHFLPDVWVECDVCHGTRYNPETLAVRYHGKSIADVLNLRVTEALRLFGNIPKIRDILQTLDDVGLGYMALGQPAPTMSGGEAQRVKLAAELARPSTGRTLYILDEPTTGLHFEDVRKLLDVLHRLVDLGNTVVVVEHNLDVIKTADWVIDLGPEAGSRGGEVVACGTPEDVVAGYRAGAPTHTGRVLEPVLAAGPHAERPRYDPQAALRARARPDDLDLAEVGQDQPLPWEADGRRWHTRDRVTAAGKPCKWDGEALALVIDTVEELGQFGPTNWNHRSIVEVPMPRKADGWFLHAHTGHEAYIRFVFRLPGRPFRRDRLAAQLGLRPLSDTPGLEGYARDADRVEVADAPGGQQVVVIIHNRAEVETPGFRAFLERAVAVAQSRVRPAARAIEDHLPWKKNGEQWHLGDNGFPPGRPPRWDRSLLPRLLRLLRELGPDLEFHWDTRDAVTIRPPGAARFWCRLRTKDPEALEAWFVGRRGAVPLGRFEGVGRDPVLELGPDDRTDTLKLRFVTPADCDPARLRPVLAEHLQAFRAVAAAAGGREAV